MKYLITLALLPFSLLYAQNNVFEDIMDAVDQQVIETNIFELCGYDSVMIDGQMELIRSRHKDRPGNELAFQFLAQEAMLLGYDTTIHQFSNSGKNLIIKKEGAVYPNQHIIICAHYDGMPGGPIGPAADDNGSSVVAVMEAMRVLKDYEFERSILFAYWDEEEQGLVGAEAYAELMANATDSIICVLNMDAIAHDSDEDFVAKVHVTPSLQTSIDFADTLFHYNTNLNLGLNLVLRNPGATYSDHAAFWDQNIPALLLIEDWDDDPNPGYHTANDDTSYFNWPYYNAMVQLAVVTTAAWAKPMSIDTSTNISIKELLNAQLVSISPNPINDVLKVNVEHTETIITFYNALGGVVAHKTLYGKTAIFDFKDLPTGTYFFIAEHGVERQRGEFLKK